MSHLGRHAQVSMALLPMPRPEGPASSVRMARATTRAHGSSLEGAGCAGPEPGEPPREVP